MGLYVDRKQFYSVLAFKIGCFKANNMQSILYYISFCWNRTQTFNDKFAIQDVEL